MFFGVVDGVAADAVIAVFAVKNSVGRAAARFQGRRRAEKLHGGAGFEGIGDRAIASHIPVEIAESIGIEQGRMGQGQNVTCLRGHDHGDPGFGLVGFHGLLEGFFGQVLNGPVDG